MKLVIKGITHPVLGMVLMMTLITILSTSCENHEPIDRNIHVGYVLCNDHSCMDTASYFNQTKRKAVGVVFAEKTDDHPALAVMFDELNEVFCDSVGMVNGTCTDITSFCGFKNTVAMYNSYSAETGKGSPLAMEMINFHANGQSDYLPCVAEQRLLASSARVINPVLEKLGGTPIALEGDCWYWTSTEVEDNPGVQAWLCSADNGRFLPTPKTQRHKARAIVEIYDPE